MGPSSAYEDLLWEFETALDAGQAPCRDDYVLRCADSEARPDLLVDLLNSELRLRSWDLEYLRGLLSRYPALEADRSRVARLVRQVHGERLARGEALEWPHFRDLGYTPEELRLAREEERHWLGEVIAGRYELRRRLGHGGHGVVFMARDLTSGRDVAVKTARCPDPDVFPEFAKVFRVEAEAAAAVAHPAIVLVRACFCDANGEPFLVMDYIDGGDLTALIDQGPVEPFQAARIVGKIADAVDHVHRRRYTHLDLKPGNILRDRAGNLFVGDLGSALHEVRQWGEEGKFRGTRPYAAPEVLLGMTNRVNRRADVWSLGILLVELLTGRPPLLDNSLEAAFVQAVVGVPLPDTIPGPLRAVCLRCLQRDPDQRYDTAGDLAAEVRLYIHPTPPVADTRMELVAWRLGARVGSATQLHVRMAQGVQQLAALPARGAGAVRTFRNAVSVIAACGVQALEEFKSCAATAAQLSLELPQAPDHAPLMRLIYTPPSTAADAAHLPAAITELGQYLSDVLAALRARLRVSSPGCRALFDLSDRAQRWRLLDEAAAQIEQAAQLTPLPAESWQPLACALREEKPPKEIDEEVHRLEKRGDDYLSEQPGAWSDHAAGAF